MEISKIVEQILKITNESPYGRLDMDSAEAGEIWKILNKALKQGQSLPIDSVSNCSQECEWKADTFDNIGIALTEYCEECGAKRDCC